MIPDGPFAPGCTRESFLETVTSREALARLADGLGAREPFLLVTGDPGTGKTALVHEAIARWAPRVTAAVLAYPPHTALELLEEILLRLGAEVPAGATRPRLVASLERVLAECAKRGQVAMIVLEDAHKLSDDVLEELRVLVNAAQQAGTPLEVLLAGLPAITSRLEIPELSALRQRISVRVSLAPFSTGETRRYLRHRVDAAGGDGASLFPRATCVDIAALSGGIARQINSLATEAVRQARTAGDSAVQPEHAHAAAAALLGSVLPREESAEDDEPARESHPAHAAAPAPAPKIVRAAAAQAPGSQVTRAPESEALAASVARAPAPPAPPVAPAPAPEVASRSEASAAATPSTVGPPSQDPREWVARFVGDRGPLQIGSQVMSRSSWAPEAHEPAFAAPSSSEEASGPRPAPRAAPPPRARRRGGISSRVATVSVLVAILVSFPLALLIRAGGHVRMSAGQPAGMSARPAQVSRPVPAPAPVAPATPPPAAALPAPAAAAPAQAAAPATERVRGPWTLDVGSYPGMQDAMDLRERVHELTGIQAWVVPAPEGSGGPNRVVLGVYRSRERADAAAAMVLRSRTLEEAKVVPLPRRGVRI